MFEGYKAKVHELLETKKAEKILTFSQEEMSRQREMWLNTLRESGVQISGDVEIQSEKVPNLGVPGSGTKSTFRGNFDGKQVEIQFTEFLPSRRNPVEATIDCKARVDGVEVIGEDARLLVEKYMSPALSKYFLDKMSKINEPYSISTMDKYSS